MRNQLSAYLNQGINVIFLLTLALIPLVFVPFTTEFFETPKLIFLAAVVLILLLLWSLSWILDGKVSLTRTPLDLPLLLLLIVVLLSTFFSETRYISALGNMPRIHGSAVAWLSYILFYFIATSSIRTESQVKTALYALLASSVVVMIITLTSYFNLYLPLPFAHTPSFTPTGSSFSTAAFLILLLPITLIAVFKPTKFMPRFFGIVLSSLFLLTIILVGNIPIYIAAAVVIGLCIFTQKKFFNTKNQNLESFVMAQTPNKHGYSEYLPWIGLILPLICLFIIVFSFIPITKSNLLYNARQKFPQELQLPFPDSWKVSVSTFRDTPFLGTGPATYLFNFSAYKPVEINSTNLWNIRFDTGFNEFLQILGTLGGLGLLAFLFLVGITLTFAFKAMYSLKDNPLGLSLGIGVVAVVVLFALHATTVVSLVISLAIMAIFMVSSKTTGKVEELTVGIKTSKYTDSSLVTGDVLPIILFIPILIFAIYIFANGYNVVYADYYHRLALDSASTRALDTYNNLIQAEKLNPNVDLYRTDLAQTNFALANSIATAKGPTEASAGGSLTDQDKQNIQTLLSQAISEGRAATQLSPKNSANWEILASIYRQISGVAQNALQFSLDSYGRAIQRDPLNPLLRLNVGGIYYSIKNYDLAIRFFADAANLKPDYANAYYNLAVALRDKGDLQSAQSAAEKLMTLLDPNSQDYKVAGQFLADIKAKAATGSAQQATTPPEQQQESGALQKKELPKVLNLPNPGNVSTPAAVKSNPNAQVPSSNPSSNP